MRVGVSRQNYLKIWNSIPMRSKTSIKYGRWRHYCFALNWKSDYFPITTHAWTPLNEPQLSLHSKSVNWAQRSGTFQMIITKKLLGSYFKNRIKYCTQTSEISTNRTLRRYQACWDVFWVGTAGGNWQNQETIGNHRALLTNNQLNQLTPNKRPANNYGCDKKWPRSRS